MSTNTKRYHTDFMPRFSDFDLQGIVNSARYLDFLSEARIDQMVRCYRMPMDHYMKKNQTWVFSSVNLNYLKPIFFGKQIRVETEVIAIEGAMATVDFSFHDAESGKVHANGKATYHLIDLASKKPVPVPAEDVEVFLSR